MTYGERNPVVFRRFDAKGNPAGEPEFPVVKSGQQAPSPATGCYWPPPAARATGAAAAVFIEAGGGITTL
ncbi:MAG TPA: hypothetical protein VGO52_06340, partial [Hyphomonadaceae bacterium]|nr:hypothetical protein [Hyphomonadaceae bacterium]